MDNHKKLFEGLLKADGIDPTGPTESERIAFATMFDEQTKPKQSTSDSRFGLWRVIWKSKTAKLAAAAVLIVATLIAVNQFARRLSFTNVGWADVVDKFASVSFYNAVLFFKEDAASEAKQIELWVSSEQKARLRVGSQVLFAESGKIAAGYNFKERRILSENEYDKMGKAIIQNFSEHRTLSLDKFVRLFYNSQLVEITPEINSDATISQDLLVFDLNSKGSPQWMRIWALRESKLPVRLRMWDPRDGECADTFVTYEKQQPPEFFDHRKYEELLLDTSRTGSASLMNLAYALLKDPGGRNYAPRDLSLTPQDGYPVKGHLSLDELVEHYQTNPLEPGQVEFRAGLSKDGITIMFSVKGLQGYRLMQIGTSVPHFAKMYHSPSTGRFRFEEDFHDIFLQYDLISRGNVSIQRQVELLLSKVGIQIVESEDDCTVWIAEYNGQKFTPIEETIPKGNSSNKWSAHGIFNVYSLLHHLAKAQDIIIEDETGIDKETYLSHAIPDFKGQEGAKLAEKWYRDNFGITFRKETRKMPVWTIRKKP
ncbi:MAG: hypothetical protein ACYS8Z_06005 [Planctomycetota bacterium]|jgi:hypothetical protein